MVTFDMSTELHYLRVGGLEVIELWAVGTLVGAGRNRLRATRISISVEGEDLGVFTHNDRVFHRPLACLVGITSAELLVLLTDGIS